MTFHADGCVARIFGDDGYWARTTCTCGAYRQPFDLQAAEPMLARVWNNATLRAEPGCDLAGWPLRDGP